MAGCQETTRKKIYRLTEAAATDLENIMEWTLQAFGSDQAGHYAQSLSACLNRIASRPGLGAAIDHIRPGYRRIRHQSHAVFYCECEWGVLIVRILHQRMDVESALKSPGPE